MRGVVAEIGRVWPPCAGRGPLVVETWATSEGITNRMVVPSSPALMVRLGTTVLPGLRLELEDVRARRPRGLSAGLYMRGPRLGGRLRGDVTNTNSASLLAVLSGVRGKETVIVQWVVAPMTRNHPKGEEISRSQFDLEIVASGRVAAWAPRRDPRRIARAPGWTPVPAGAKRDGWAELSIYSSSPARCPKATAAPLHLAISTDNPGVGRTCRMAKWLGGCERARSRC